MAQRFHFRSLADIDRYQSELQRKIDKVNIELADLESKIRMIEEYEEVLDGESFGTRFSALARTDREAAERLDALKKELDEVFAYRGGTYSLYSLIAGQGTRNARVAELQADLDRLPGERRRLRAANGGAHGNSANSGSRAYQARKVTARQRSAEACNKNNKGGGGKSKGAR